MLNRVTKVADWTPVRELSLQGGSFGNRRTALDVGQGITEGVALRLNGVYENSDLYRNEVNIERYGINPTATIQLSPQTRVLASYEHFKRQSHRRPGNSVLCRSAALDHHAAHLLR